MADTETTPKPPPNLRVSGDESKECGDCKHYKETMTGVCMLDTGSGPLCLPVDDEWLCDSWAAGGKDADADEDQQDEKPPAKNVRQAEQNFRARRQPVSVNDGKPQ